MSFRGKIASIMIILPILLICSENIFAAESLKTANQSSTKVLKVGVPFALSGPAALWGIPCSNGVKLIANKINENGGIRVGNNIYHIEPIIVDTKLTPEGSAAAAHKLIYDHKVKYIIGLIVDHEVQSFLPITESENVLMMSGFWDKKLLSPENKYLYRTYLGPYELFPSLWSWVADNYPEATKVAALGVDDVSGHVGMEILSELLPQLGFNLVAKIFYPYGEKDFTSHVTRALLARPHVIAPQGDPPSQASIIKMARDMGYDGLIGRSSPVDEKTFVGIAGKEYIEGYFSTLEIATDGPFATKAAKDLKKEYITKYKEWTPMGVPPGFSYGLPVLKAAIEMAGSLKPEEVKKVLDSGYVFKTMFGPASFGGEEVYGQPHQILYNAFIGKIIDGSITPIERLELNRLHGFYEMYWK